MAKYPKMIDGVPMMKDGVPLCAEEGAEDPCGCCGAAGCPLCGDATPATLTLTLAGVTTVSGCISCFDGQDSVQGDGADINGTYTLNYAGTGVNIANCPGGDDQTYCDWTATFAGPAITVYQCSNDCGGTTACPATATYTMSTWTIRLRKMKCPADANPQWTLEVFAQNTVTVQLFTESAIDGTTNCENDYPSFTNAANGNCGLGTYYGAGGGTGTIAA